MLLVTSARKKLSRKESKEAEVYACPPEVTASMDKSDLLSEEEMPQPVSSMQNIRRVKRIFFIGRCFKISYLTKI